MSKRYSLSLKLISAITLIAFLPTQACASYLRAPEATESPEVQASLTGEMNGQPSPSDPILDKIKSATVGIFVLVVENQEITKVKRGTGVIVNSNEDKMQVLTPAHLVTGETPEEQLKVYVIVFDRQQNKWVSCQVGKIEKEFIRLNLVEKTAIRVDSAILEIKDQRLKEMQPLSLELADEEMLDQPLPPFETITGLSCVRVTWDNIPSDPFEIDDFLKEPKGLEHIVVENLEGKIYPRSEPDLTIEYYAFEDGDSGAPILNSDGQIVGMFNSKFGNFFPGATPVYIIRDFMDNVKADAIGMPRARKQSQGGFALLPNMSRVFSFAKKLWQRSISFTRRSYVFAVLNFNRIVICLIYITPMASLGYVLFFKYGQIPLMSYYGITYLISAFLSLVGVWNLFHLWHFLTYPYFEAGKREEYKKFDARIRRIHGAYPTLLVTWNFALYAILLKFPFVFIIFGLSFLFWALFFPSLAHCIIFTISPEESIMPKPATGADGFAVDELKSKRVSWFVKTVIQMARSPETLGFFREQLRKLLSQGLVMEGRMVDAEPEAQPELLIDGFQLALPSSMANQDTKSESVFESIFGGEDDESDVSSNADASGYTRTGNGTKLTAALSVATVPNLMMEHALAILRKEKVEAEKAGQAFLSYLFAESIANDCIASEISEVILPKNTYAIAVSEIDYVRHDLAKKLQETNRFDNVFQARNQEEAEVMKASLSENSITLIFNRDINKLLLFGPSAAVIDIDEGMAAALQNYLAVAASI